MGLGELELEVLTVVRRLGVAPPGRIFREVRKDRDVAYTSVTTTLYRLVDKDLVTTRKQAGRRVMYAIKDGRAYNRAIGAMVSRLVDAFGPAAISHFLEKSEDLSEEERRRLTSAVERARKEEGERGNR